MKIARRAGIVLGSVTAALAAMAASIPAPAPAGVADGRDGPLRAGQQRLRLLGRHRAGQGRRLGIRRDQSGRDELARGRALERQALAGVVPAGRARRLHRRRGRLVTQRHLGGRRRVRAALERRPVDRGQDLAPGRGADIGRRDRPQRRLGLRLLRLQRRSQPRHLALRRPRLDQGGRDRRRDLPGQRRLPPRHLGDHGQPGGGSVVHYDGRAWTARRRRRPALANTQLDDVLAVSPTSVWVSGISPANGADGHLVLVRWNGRCWKRFVAPWPVQQPERFASDGAGGIWIPVVTGGDSPATWILHLSRAGAWTRTKIAAGRGRGRRRRPGPHPRDQDGMGHRRAADHAGRQRRDLGARGTRHPPGHPRAPVGLGHGPRAVRLAVAGHGEIVRIYLTVGDRGTIRVFLATRGCRASGRGPRPAWDQPGSGPPSRRPGAGTRSA